MVSIRTFITVVIVAVAMGITIAISPITVTETTHRDATREHQTNEKQDPNENQFLIHMLAPFVSSLSV
jgi:uncharacterized alpha/beta hydrolase family protein